MRRIILNPTVVTLIGCGGSDNGNGGRSFNAEGDARYTEEQVAALAGFRADEDGLSWTGPGGCYIAVILTTRAAVELYAGAGDAVVTNPAGDVGVKFGASEPACREKLLAALDKVE